MEEKMTIQQEIVSAFIDKWIAVSKPKSILRIQCLSGDYLPVIPNSDTHNIYALFPEEIQSKYDLLIGYLSIFDGSENYDYKGKSLRIPFSWKDVPNSLDFLDDNGTALFAVDAFGFNANDWKSFEVLLNQIGCYPSAFIRLPVGLFNEKAKLSPTLVVITKRKVSRVLVDELLDPVQAEYLVDSYFFPTEIRNSDKYILPGCFPGFNSIIIHRQIERLETQYKNFSQRSLSEMAIEINSLPSGGTFSDKANSIYIPKTKFLPVKSHLEDVSNSHDFYFQVVLDQSVLNSYLAAFFRSTLGKLSLESILSGKLGSSLNETDVEGVLVAVPTLDEQISIVNTIETLSRLKSALTDFDSEIVLNPSSSSLIQPKLNSMLDVIDGLTEIERINALIREGESKRLEFKSTLSLDLRTQAKEKNIELASLKTVVAFLNSDGGNLLVGVSDDGAILGLNQEINKFYKNTDKFLLHWKDLLKQRVGEQFYPFIDYRLIDIDGNQVLFVDVKPSPNLPCYLDNIDFYVRTNPATDKLEGPKLVQYVKYRFPA